MPKYEITLADGRKTGSYAPDEAAAIAQAEHEERTRIQIAQTRAIIAGQQGRLRGLVVQFGEAAATQMMLAVDPRFVMPDLSQPDPVPTDIIAISAPVHCIKVKN